MDEAKYQMQRQGWHKAPQWLVTPEEIAKMHPLLKMDDVLGGLFNPGQFYGIMLNTVSNQVLWLHRAAVTMVQGNCSAA